MTGPRKLDLEASTTIVAYDVIRFAQESIRDDLDKEKTVYYEGDMAGNASSPLFIEEFTTLQKTPSSDYIH